MHNKTPEPQNKDSLKNPKDKLPPVLKEKEVKIPDKDFMTDPIYNNQYLDC